MRKNVFLLLFVLFTLSNIHAQYYATGQDPSSIKWKQINTKYFRIIFPESNYFNAQKLANLLDTTFKASLFDISSRTVKTDIILHTNSIISNAMVAWAPRRAEFFNTPPQDGYAQEWYKQLAVHELRHIAQISKLNTGFGKVVSTIFGQQGTIAAFGLFIPNWFIEGDAVANETAMSKSGRGRSPLFEAGLRAQLIEKGYYVYDKAYFGSYKDYTPNVYELGYQIVAHNKVKYGAMVWEKPLDFAANKPYAIFPFTIGLKKNTGSGKNNLYKETMFDLYDSWKKDFDSLQYSEYELLTPTSKHYTSYHFPQTLSDGSIVSVKTSMDHRTRIVKIENNKETFLFNPGSIIATSLSATDSLVVWNEYQPDPRWENRNYSVIKIGVLKTGEIKQFTKKSKLFAPALSSDNRKILATQTDIYGNNSVIVLATAHGEQLFSFGCDTLFFQTPRWHPNKHDLATVVVGEQGKSIMIINTLTGENRFLLPFSFDDIAISDVTEKEVIFSAPYSGINNIYAINIENAEIRQLSSSKFGATDAIIDNKNRLIYSDYDANGFHLASLSVDKQLRKILNNIPDSHSQLAENLSKMSLFSIDGLSNHKEIFPVKSYSKWGHLVNIHSWAPVFIDAFNYEGGIGASIMSQNALSTMTAQLGYKYDLNEQTGKTVFNLEYAGWYPVIDAGFSSGLRRDQTTHEGTLYNLKWQETEVTAGFKIPLNFTHDEWIRGMQPRFGYAYILKQMDPSVGLDFAHDRSQSLTYDYFLYNQSRMSLRDLMPRWGQSLQLVFRHTPFDNTPSNQAMVSAAFNFPGIFNHHALKVMLAKQWYSEGDYPFQSLIKPARGYTDMFANATFAIKSDYVFPVFYPDLDLPTIFYLKRIRAGLFYDFVYYEGMVPNTLYNSAGMEIYSDWNFFNWPAPINLGFRLSHTFNDNLWHPEFLFGINMSALY